jgi:hypothetical protein
MDLERARELLAAERRELERTLGHRGHQDDGEIAGFQEPANLAAELNLDNSTKPSPPTFMNGSRLSSVPNIGWPQGHTASRSRPVSRSPMSASRPSRRPSGPWRKSAL